MNVNLNPPPPISRFFYERTCLVFLSHIFKFFYKLSDHNTLFYDRFEKKINNENCDLKNKTKNKQISGH